MLIQCSGHSQSAVTAVTTHCISCRLRYGSACLDASEFFSPAEFQFGTWLPIPGQSCSSHQWHITSSTFSRVGMQLSAQCCNAVFCLFSISSYCSVNSKSIPNWKKRLQRRNCFLFTTFPHTWDIDVLFGKPPLLFLKEKWSSSFYLCVIC